MTAVIIDSGAKKIVLNLQWYYSTKVDSLNFMVLI